MAVFQALLSCILQMETVLITWDQDPWDSWMQSLDSSMERSPTVLFLMTTIVPFTIQLPAIGQSLQTHPGTIMDRQVKNTHKYTLIIILNFYSLNYVIEKLEK